MEATAMGAHEQQRPDRVPGELPFPNPKPPKPKKSEAQKALERQQRFDADPVNWFKFLRSQGNGF